MCHECQGIDRTIGHYRHIEKLTIDRQTLDSIHILIAKLEADKRALHPDSTWTTERPIPGGFRSRKITEPLPREDE